MPGTVQEKMLEPAPVTDVLRSAEAHPFGGHCGISPDVIDSGDFLHLDQGMSLRLGAILGKISSGEAIMEVTIIHRLQAKPDQLARLKRFIRHHIRKATQSEDCLGVVTDVTTGPSLICYAIASRWTSLAAFYDYITVQVNEDNLLELAEMLSHTPEMIIEENPSEKNDDNTVFECYHDVDFHGSRLIQGCTEEGS